MSRYYSQKRGRASDDWFDDPLLPPIVVSEHVWRDTGLLDKDGNPILKEPNPIGFHRWT